MKCDLPDPNEPCRNTPSALPLVSAEFTYPSARSNDSANDSVAT